MKILAIRGKNLASLGDFVLDFQQEPLASAGLFAITGVTGAGKSTILDALCLALYNQTPRLARVKQGSIDLADVGEHRVRINHPQTLLRRGAIEGFAEVDFLGHDNRMYRAKWSVRRARGQSSGQLQDEQLSLLNIDNDSTIGHRKREVLEAIQERIGLSFDEFNRAVLLAQNEFFAFLKSDDNERASLLEALTGTSQFSDLSIQAFLRARHEKEQLTRLETQLAGQIPLSIEERTQLALLAEQLEQQTILDQQRIRELSTSVTWQHTHSDLEQKLQIAQHGVEQAQLAWQNNIARQQFFLQIEAIQSARTLVENQERLDIERNKQQVLLLNTREKQQHQQHELQQLQHQQQQTLITLNQHELAYQHAQPLLEQAKTLDTKLDGQQQRLQQSKEALANASQRLNQSSFKLLPQWEALQALLTQAKLSLSFDDNQTAKEQTLSCQANAEQSLAEAQITLNQYDIETIAEEKNHVTQQLQQQQQLLRHWQDWQTTQIQQHNSQQESETLQQRNESIGQRLIELTPQLAIRTATVQQAQKAQDQAKLACAENVELLRSQLQDDSPCPVCGSQQHPYNQHINSQLQQLLNTLAVELQQQQHSHAQLLTEQIQLNSELQNQKPRLQTLSSEQLQRQQALIALEDTLKSDSLLLAIEAAERESWLNNNIQKLNQQLTQMNEQEQHYRLALKQRDVAQALVNASRLLVDCASSLFDYAHEFRLLTELKQLRSQYFEGEPVLTIEMNLKESIQQAQQLNQHAIEQLNVLKEQNIATTQQQHSIEQNIQTLGDELLLANEALAAWLARYHLEHPNDNLDISSLKKLLTHDNTWLQQERMLIQKLQTAITNAETNLHARQQDLQQHMQAQPLSILAIEQLEQQLAVLQNQLQLNQKQLGSYEQQLHQDSLRQQQTAALRAQLQMQQAQADIWQQLNSVIGSADGKVFRNAAQQMTLDVLLFYTNAHLKDLAKRYRLERVDGSLGMQVIDQDMGDEVRSVHSLSGGESFLVSLALALGLASLSSQRVKVESLFIDEGFGSLDAETLRVAMDALDILQSQGRKVGVISHVAEMTERIPTQIQVRKGTGGKSSVHVIPET